MPRPQRSRRGSVDWEIDTSRLNRILSNLEGNTSQAVRAVAFSIEAKAKKLAPVDTGALRNSIYVRVGRQPTPIPMLETSAAREELPEPDNETTAVIGPSVEYAIYQEFGTMRMASHPFLGPAVNGAADELEAQMRGVVTNGE